MDYIRENLLKIAKIGEDRAGGISRVFGSSAMQEGQRTVETYFQECGLETWIDPAGNVHGIYRCGREDAGEIFIGSHLDTVKQGGMFDGLLGIVAGAECIRKLCREKFPFSDDIHLIATNGEEGNELGGTFGSRAMMGMLPLDSEEYVKIAGKYGYTPENLKDAVLDTGRARCYLELHIEQGAVLEKHKEKIGVVTGIAGLRRYKITVYGQSNHAGTTMMEDRDDALVSAARIILKGNDLAVRMGGQFVETVGMMQVYPGSAPVIPGRVEMIVEIRSARESQMDCFMTGFEKMVKETAKADIEPVVAKAPVKCGGVLVDMIEKICEERKIPCRKMSSGATHDGNAMASGMPVGMIFVPSRNGISHAKEEWTDWEDAALGAEVLTETVRRLQAKEEK